MSNAYEKSVFIGNLAGQCKRYADIVEVMEDFLKGKDSDLEVNERNILLAAYEKILAQKRSELKPVRECEEKEKKIENSPVLCYVQEYRGKIEDEIINTCNRIIQVIYNHLLKRAEQAEAKVIYLKLLGDVNRQIAECTRGDQRMKAVDSALAAYKDAAENAKAISAIHPASLGLMLNFSIFYHDLMHDHETARHVAKDTLEEANNLMASIDDPEESESHRESLAIINTLREAYDTWVMEDDEGE